MGFSIINQPFLEIPIMETPVFEYDEMFKKTWKIMLDVFGRSRSVVQQWKKIYICWSNSKTYQNHPKPTFCYDFDEQFDDPLPKRTKYHVSCFESHFLI